MREFKNIAEFTRFMQGRIASTGVVAEAGLERAAEAIAKEAKAEIGHYQESAGPFVGWKELSSATLDGFDHPQAGYIPGKRELGYADAGNDNPLERTGGLRDSYEHTVRGREAEVGSNADEAVWQEMGTMNALYPIPPRAVLGIAAVHKEHEAVDFIAGNVVRHIAGQ